LSVLWQRTRDGLEEVSRELERAHRTGASLVLAFIDVDGLKQAANAKHSVTFGLAEAEPTDSLQDLIARADVDFLEARRSGKSNG
jgi:PleD family two-component response regulator